MKVFSKTPLSLAVGLLVMTPALAADEVAEPAVKLETMTVKLQKKLNDTKMRFADNKRRTETDLRGVLKDEPAIDFGGGTATSQWTTIRGIGQNQLDLKVDNVYSDARLFRYQGRFMIDPTLTKVVGIQKGTGSASAGIGATSGAIVAKTIDAKELLVDTDKDFGMKLNLGYASNDGYSYGVAGFGKHGKFDGLLAFNVNDEDDYKGGKGYTNVDGSDKVQHSEIKQKSILAKVGVDINDDHRITLSHRYEQQSGLRALREQYDMSLNRFALDEDRPLTPAQVAMGYVKTDEFAGWNRRRNPATKTYYVKNKNTGNYVSGDEANRVADRTNTVNSTNLEWMGKNMGFVDYADANIYYMNAKRDTTPEDLAGIPPTAGATLITRGFNVNLNSEFEPFGIFNNGYLLKYGVNYRYQIGKPTWLAKGYQNQEKTDTGLYVEGIGEIGDFTLTTGLRYDHFRATSMNQSWPEEKHGQFNPSIGLIYQATPELAFNASHNYASRSPRMYEPSIATGDGSNRINMIANIKPETARTSEIGFDYNRGDLALKGTYFWQNIKDVHGYLGARSDSQLANLGTLKNTGYEINAGYRYHDLTARFGVAHSKPRLDGNLADDATLFMAETGRTWTTSLAYQLNPKLELGWRGRFVEDAYTPPGTGGGDSLAGVTREGYNLHDIFVNYRPYGNGKFNVNFAVNNLTNKNYMPHSQIVNNISLAGAGRDVRLGINYTF